MKILLISVLVIVLIVFIIYVGTGLAFLRLMSISFNDPEHEERYKRVLKKKGITGDAADKEFREITELFKTTRFKLTIIFRWPAFSDNIAKTFGIEKLSDVNELRKSLSVPKEDK